MQSEKKTKQDLKRLMAKKLGKKIDNNYNKDLMMNTAFDNCQFLEILQESAGLKENKFINSAIAHLRERGLNRSINQLSEITKLAAFLHGEIKSPGGGIKAPNEDDSEDDEVFYD